MALAYEAYNKGLLTKKETEGLELNWGNADAAILLLQKIIRKEGIGAILEKGPKEAAQILSQITGKDLKPLSTDIKGCPVISHDYRWSWQKMLSQAVGSFGPVSQGGNLDFGIEPERFRLEWVSAAEGPRFAQVVTEFTEQVKMLGPNPNKM